MTIRTLLACDFPTIRHNGGRWIIVGNPTLRPNGRIYLPVRRSLAGSRMYGRTQYVRAANCTPLTINAAPLLKTLPRVVADTLLSCY